MGCRGEYLKSHLPTINRDFVMRVFVYRG